MDTIIMTSENRKTSMSHVLILNFTNKIDLRIGEKVLPYQILVFVYMEKHEKLK